MLCGCHVAVCERLVPDAAPPVNRREGHRRRVREVPRRMVGDLPETDEWAPLGERLLKLPVCSMAKTRTKGGWEVAVVDELESSDNGKTENNEVEARELASNLEREKMYRGHRVKLG